MDLGDDRRRRDRRARARRRGRSAAGATATPGTRTASTRSTSGGGSRAVDRPPHRLQARAQDVARVDLGGPRRRRRRRRPRGARISPVEPVARVGASSSWSRRGPGRTQPAGRITAPATTGPGERSRGPPRPRPRRAEKPRGGELALEPVELAQPTELGEQSGERVGVTSTRRNAELLVGPLLVDARGLALARRAGSRAWRGARRPCARPRCGR